MLRSLLLLFALVCFYFTNGQIIRYIPQNQQQTNIKQTQWADSVLQELTPRQRIGQLFMVATYSTNDKRNNASQIKNLITKYGIGGLIFMQGTPQKQIQYTNEYQKLSKVPLLVGMDLERGLGFRLKNTVSFQHNMTLGALQNDSLIYQLGREIGKQCRQIGVQVNFAPVIDINNNKANPIIGVRSFGENRMNVAKKGYAFMRGLQDEHILAVGKHFPGHGDTHIDSHHGLPVLDFSKNRMDSLELFPFKLLSHLGIGGIMTAHLRVNAMDSLRTASLSHKIVTDLLQKEIGFRGLIFTDALNMGGVANYMQPGEIELEALKAGNNILLFSQNVPKAIEMLVKASKNNPTLQKKIDRSVRKILNTKYWTRIQKKIVLPDSAIQQKLNNRHTKLLQEKIAKEAVTLIKNKKNLLPFKDLQEKKIASIVIGSTTKNTFQKQLEMYAPITHFNLSPNATPKEYHKILQVLKNYTTVIVSKHLNTTQQKTQFGATKNAIDFLKQIEVPQVIFTYFGFPYGLSFYNLDKVDAIVIGYEDNLYAQKAVAQALFGGIAISGKLPVTIDKTYREGWGIKTPKTRLGYTFPENEGFDKDSLEINIRKIVEKGIQKKAMPGCQVLVARNGNIVYNKAFGYHTYRKQKAVKTTDLYDLASLTKVSATLPYIMQSYDHKQLKLTTRLDSLFSEFSNTDKADITLEDILTHETGFPSWIPFYKLLIDDNSYKGNLISYRKNKRYSIQIDQRAWLNNKIRLKKNLFSKQGSIVVGKNISLNKSVLPLFLDSIKNVTLSKKKDYRYSDLGFILLGEYFKKKGHWKDSLQLLYSKLGATRVCMLPWQKKSFRTVPTAKEYFLRKQLINGYVHDLNAALLGGIAGHAGLFASANDLAKIWQMYLQKGSYGGEQYIQKETLKLFTDTAHPDKSRRGYGFDKPEPNKKKKSPFAENVPLTGFGHSGFTGTMVWADPDNNLIYIFLSNRIYPHDWNKKMYQMNIRTRIQNIIYKTLQPAKKSKDNLKFTPIIY